MAECSPLPGCHSPGCTAWLGLALLGDAPVGHSHCSRSLEISQQLLHALDVTRDRWMKCSKRNPIFFPVFVGVLGAEPCRKQ